MDAKRALFFPLMMTSLCLTITVATPVSSNEVIFISGTMSYRFIDPSKAMSHLVSHLPYQVLDSKEFLAKLLFINDAVAPLPENACFAVYVTVITGWVLGHGPCGPGCNEADVGSPTRHWRLQRISSTGDPTIFGSWSTETSANFTVVIKNVTNVVNNNIDGRVAAVSTRSQWELEIAHTELEIDPAQKYTDIVLQLSRNETFDLNDDYPISHHVLQHGELGKRIRVQTKLFPAVRNDTHQPNNSPLVLYQPVYRVMLNRVTKIRLTTVDKDGDLVECRMAENVELEGIVTLRNVSVTKDCVVTVTAMSRDGFRDNSRGMVALVLDELTRNPITWGSGSLKAYDAHPLGSSILEKWVSVHNTDILSR
ncbi:uncharacterized protein LOC143281481 [Babylonia areolata]|uniref:uncharacterized protein LOC143281481 n=1 Tax=Babylonia areolata TaxID=304850 RepID=UPI003FD52D4E